MGHHPDSGKHFGALDGAGLPGAGTFEKELRENRYDVVGISSIKCAAFRRNR